VAQVQAGPGSQTRATRVLSLSASCGSVDFECPPEYIETVDGIVRSTMEFAGYSLVEPRTLRVETRERTETREREVVESDRSSRTTENRPLDFDRDVTSESRSRTTRTTSTTVLTGPGFDDLTVGERKQVLAEAGADSVLNVRVVVGARVGEWSPNQNVEVMVRLGVEGGDVMAWASRCSASSNTYSTVNAALENAARCAVYGGTGR
jgi:hypothetical protein